jgi:hypothetical protein
MRRPFPCLLALAAAAALAPAPARALYTLPEGFLSGSIPRR